MQIDVVVTERDKTHEKGLFKKGTVITIDLEDMEAYHCGLRWNIVRVASDYKLAGFNTFFEEV